MYDETKTVAVGELLLHAHGNATKSAIDAARRKMGKVIAGVCLLGAERTAQ
jgi:hypothetical protein